MDIFPFGGGGENLVKPKADVMVNLHWTTLTNIVLKGDRIDGRLYKL